MAKTPIEALMDKAVKFKCTLCQAPMGQCDCWQPCPCGWSKRKGEACNNPIHAVEEKVKPHVRRHRQYCKVCECDMWEADNHVGKGWCDACADCANG